MFKRRHRLASFSSDDFQVPPGCAPDLLHNFAPIDPSENSFKVLPLGIVKSTKGVYVVDEEESVPSIIQHFRDKGSDMVIDYEHQTIVGGIAPAAGWIHQGDLFTGEGGLFAKAAWTDKARKYLQDREYRYQSPVIFYRKSDKKVMAIHSVALTNDPAILNAEPILNKFQLEPHKEGIMDELVERLIYMLNLPLTTTTQELISELDTIVGKLRAEGENEGQTEAAKHWVGLAEALKSHFEAVGAALTAQEGLVPLKDIAALIGIPEGADLPKVKGTILALKNPTGVVSREEHEDLKAQIDTMNAKELVDQALKDGKVTPAMQEWAKDLATRDPATFKEFLKAQPVVVPVGKGPMLPTEPRGLVADDVQLAINSQLGIDAETFKQYGPKAAE